MMKKWIAAVTALLLLFATGLAAVAETQVASVTGTGAEVGFFRDYNKQDKYEYIQFGHYPQTKAGDVQPVLWRVLDAYDDGRALLLAEYVLDAHQIIEETDPRVKENHTYRKITTIEESDLYTWMNDVMAPALFSENELTVLDTSRGVTFLPTDEEYLTPAYGFSTARYGEDRTRQCNCTDYAKAQGVYREGKCSTYWCNNVKAPADHKLQLVGVNGHLSYGGYTRSNVGVRPAIIIMPETVTFVSGSGTKDDPYVVDVLNK